ncbi:MAG: flagellar biosynthetic protein FliO [Desulfohalobiaceae bacterium]|nr:flagellar biosynthetic protein FliO [Desulfohalobiaceae bacterium]MCF8085599.1 flagellar biosynthetic protein FliO [Desulfohalobiaceae bacterium]
MKIRLSLFFALIPTAAMAAPYEAPGLFPALLKMVAGLALVLGILLVLYALSRKGRFFGSGKRGEIQIREIRQLGGKKAICLVSVRGRDMLLGLGQDRIEMLSHVPGDGTSSGFEDELSREREK